ncbi:MAG: ParA family protein [Dehalococcoidia bacterium]
MSQKLALINMKGGVGKSTLAVNIAWEFATAPRNLRVLLVDLDPQFNASQYTVGARRMENLFQNDQPTVWDVFEQLTRVPGRIGAGPLNPQDALVPVYHSRVTNGRLDLMASRLELSNTLRNPTGKEQLLEQAISGIEDDYDVIVIDCAPTESILTTAAYLVADWILIPVRPEFLSTIGLPLLTVSLAEFDARYPGRSPEIAGIVFNAISNYSPEEVTSRQEVIDLVRERRWYVFQREVRYSKSFPKGAREGAPIFNTSYAHSQTKANFVSFANELATRVRL